MPRVGRIWSYFTLIDENTKKAECNYCKNIFSYKSTITNLKHHLKQKHIYVFEEMSSSEPRSSNEAVRENTDSDMASPGGEEDDVNCYEDALAVHSIVVSNNDNMTTIEPMPKKQKKEGSNVKCKYESTSVPEHKPSVKSDFEHRIKIDGPLMVKSFSPLGNNKSSPDNKSIYLHLDPDENIKLWSHSQATSLSENIVTPQALVWSKKMLSLDPSQRVYAEKFINDIFFEAELGNLNRFSVKINDMYDPLLGQNNH